MNGQLPARNATGLPAPGDILDVMRLIAGLLADPDFKAYVEQLATIKGIDPPFTASGDYNVFESENLTRQIFPQAEMLAYSVIYGMDTQVRDGRHKLGIRWTVLERDEVTATRAVKLLTRATVDFMWGDPYVNGGTLPGGAGVNMGPVTVIEEDYSPLIPNADHAFIKSGVVIIEVSTWRD